MTHTITVPTSGVKPVDVGAGLRFHFAMVLNHARLCEDEWGATLFLAFVCPDRDKPDGAWNELVMREVLPLHTWRVMTEEHRRQWIRSAIADAVAHEVDECLRLADGTRPWDPHQGEP